MTGDKRKTHVDVDKIKGPWAKTEERRRLRRETRSEILSEVMSAITEARPYRTGVYDDFGSGVEKGFDDCWEIVLRMLEGKYVEK